MTTQASPRLYKEIAAKLLSEIQSGKYPVGARLPAERDLALKYAVSRPVVREAIIALEVQGLVDVRVGSGVYVLSTSEQKQVPAGNVSAIELTEARLLVESEVAALAAAQITDEELIELETLVTGSRKRTRPQVARKRRMPPSIWPSQKQRATVPWSNPWSAFGSCETPPERRLCCMRRPGTPISSRWSTNTP